MVPARNEIASGKRDDVRMLNIYLTNADASLAFSFIGSCTLFDPQGIQSWSHDRYPRGEPKCKHKLTKCKGSRKGGETTRTEK